MSTRSTLVYSTNTGNHIWEETNEPVSWFSKFVGYNIYGVIGYDEAKQVILKDADLLILFIKDSYLDYMFPEGLKIYAGDLIKMELESDGIEFGIKGDSTTARLLRELKNTKVISNASR